MLWFPSEVAGVYRGARGCYAECSARSSVVIAKVEVESIVPLVVTVNAEISTSGGDVTLEANAGVTLSGANADITTTGGAYTVNSAQQSVEFRMIFQGFEQRNIVNLRQRGATITPASLIQTGAAF